MSSPQSPQPVRCVIFTKPPVPGTCKTRLIPALGPEGAARLHQAMAEDVFELALRAGLQVEISLAGDMDHPWVRALPFKVTPQVRGDLGARMAAILQPGPVLALGTDAPTLPLSFLHQAASFPSELVLGPAFDGGYWCIGWTRPQPQLLKEMVWSQDTVLAETLLRARATGLNPTLLPFWYDVDTPDVLSLLRQQLRFLPPSTAPRTRELLNASDKSGTPPSP